MSPATLAAQAASALDVLAHIRRDRDGGRRVEQLALWPGQDQSPASRMVWTRTGGLGPAAGTLRERLVEAQVAVPDLLDRA
jgi:hypothetical protein